MSSSSEEIARSFLGSSFLENELAKTQNLKN